MRAICSGCFVRQRSAHVSLLDAGETDGEALELSSTELRDLALENDVQVEGSADLLEVVPFELPVKHLLHARLPLDRARDVVDVLRLDQRLEVVLENLREVILKFGSAEVLEDVLPVGRVLRHRIVSSVEESKTSDGSLTS